MFDGGLQARAGLSIRSPSAGVDRAMPLALQPGFGMGGNLTGAIEDFDAIVVGAGQAGPPLAAMLAGAGMRVAIVERHLIGGTCLNVGCTPTKTMIASAHVAHVARPRWARVAREHRCGYAAQRAARLVV